MQESPAPRPTLPLVATLVWGTLLLPGLLGAALSPMFFDAPGSMNNPAAWTNALIIVSFPFLCLVSIAGSWILWGFRKRATAAGTPYASWAVALLPALPIAYVAVVMIVGTIGVLTSGQPLGLHSTIIKH
jgi:heme/copper-type cytochrome/quinol oxidase subunit 2